jgi:hypothetical protein
MGGLETLDSGAEEQYLFVMVALPERIAECRYTQMTCGTTAVVFMIESHKTLRFGFWKRTPFEAHNAYL